MMITLFRKRASYDYYVSFEHLLVVNCLCNCISNSTNVALIPLFVSTKCLNFKIGIDKTITDLELEIFAEG